MRFIIANIIIWIGISGFSSYSINYQNNLDHCLNLELEYHTTNNLTIIGSKHCQYSQCFALVCNFFNKVPSAISFSAKQSNLPNSSGENSSLMIIIALVISIGFLIIKLFEFANIYYRANYRASFIINVQSIAMYMLIIVMIAMSSYMKFDCLESLQLQSMTKNNSIIETGLCGSSDCSILMCKMFQNPLTNEIFGYRPFFNVDHIFTFEDTIPIILLSLGAIGFVVNIVELVYRSKSNSYS